MQKENFNGFLEFIKTSNDLYLAMQIIKERQKFDLSDEDVLEILKNINNPQFTKNIIKNREEYKLDDDIILSLIISINNPELTKEIIENREEYKLDDDTILNLIISINNPELTKEIIENGEKYGLRSGDVLELVESTNDREFMKKIVKNKEKYGFHNTYIVSLLENINEPEFTKEIIKKQKQYGLYGIDILCLLNLVDLEFAKEIIKNNKQYDLNEDEIKIIIEFIKDPDYIKEIIKDREKYGFSKDFAIDLMIDMSNHDFVREIIGNKEEYGLDSDSIIKVLQNIEDYDYIEKIIDNKEKYGLSNMDIIELLDNIPEEDRVEELKKLGKKATEAYRQKYASKQFIKEHVKDFLEIEENNVNSKLLLEMAEKNEDILKADFEILNDRYVKALGKDKVNQISCYPNIVKRVLKLNDGELELISKALDSYLEETNGEEWTPFANRLLDNISGYKELIENIEENDYEIDIKEIALILVHKNDLGIKTIQDVENYSEIKAKKCEELIKSKSIEEKRKGVLLKIFGQSLEESEELVEKYEEDIEKIEDEDLKAYIESLGEILRTKKEKTLDKIYEKVDELEKSNPLLMERKLKTEYWNLYNKDLFKVEDAKKLPGEKNIYSAGTEFKMIITSVAPYVYNQPENYNDDWNRASLASQHFCASYIRNDMLGHAIVPHICYGFEEMNEDSLMLSGPGDIWSSEAEFESKSSTEKYLAPENQIRKTKRYNEMDFRRVQGGKKKQPDYIVVFKKYGEIFNLEKAQKASEEFGNLPIVIIDEDECLIAERKKAENLFKEYKKTKDSQVRAELVEKLRNNRVTNPEFCRDTNMDEVLEIQDMQDISDGVAEKEVSSEDLKEIYGKVNAKDRQSERGKLKIIYEQIKNIMGKELDNEEK